MGFHKMKDTYLLFFLLVLFFRGPFLQSPFAETKSQDGIGGSLSLFNDPEASERHFNRVGELSRFKSNSPRGKGRRLKMGVELRRTTSNIQFLNRIVLCKNRQDLIYCLTAHLFFTTRR